MISKTIKWLFILLILSSYLFAQQKNAFLPKWIYGSVGFENKTNSYNYGATFIFNNNWGISYMNETFSKVARFMPNDYHSGGILWSTDLAYDEFNIQSIRLLKEFDLPKMKLIRLGVEVGPAFCKTAIAHFTYFHTGGWFSTDGYHINYTKENSMGLLLRTKFAFPYAQFAGLEFSTTGIFLGKNSGISIGLFATFGRMRKRIKLAIPKKVKPIEQQIKGNNCFPNRDDIEEFYSPTQIQRN